jgi:methionine aminotransferase
MEIRSKLPNVGTTIFTTMSALAVEHKAINLGQGFPSFHVDPVWGDLMKKHIDAGRNQYCPMPGLPELRNAIAHKVNTAYNSSVNPLSDITITAGATQAIFTAISAFIGEGDEVILFAPAYDCYAPAIELNGGMPVWIDLRYPDYSIPWNEVNDKISDRTKIIIINHPHNPSGASISENDITQLIASTRDTNIIVLSDEVYEHIIFDGREHLSILKYPELAERSMAVFSFGKTFHLTGWKMGYIISNPQLMVEFRKVHQYNVFCCNTPAQWALTEYLENPNNYLSLPNFYQEKRDRFNSLIAESKFKIVPSAGTYFQLLNYSDITQENDVDVAIRWTMEHGVTGIPCSVFYPKATQDNVLRFCFAKDDETLEMAAEILCKIKV